MSALVFAAPPTVEKYSISISGTDYFLLSNGTEQVGQPVTLVTGYNPDTTLVSIRNLRRARTSASKIIGKAGLSVAAGEDAGGAPYLVWDSRVSSKAWWTFQSRSPEQGYFIRGAEEGWAWVGGPNGDLVLQPGGGSVFTIQVAV
ncbi:hypothetical protein F5887DRAFT_917106 [Amanita rubescens]|nr:hypothetical protein F5887DRAFT_917106 [Amanita rubescens]